MITIDSLLHDLNVYPDKVVLIPAPESRFEGHMIRVRECAGPLWLQLLRQQECIKVRRYVIKRALLTMRDKGWYRYTRYIKLIERVISGDVYDKLN